mmetsp:Transcript_96741/g.144858  ORF Transcript_96741/g.144858 Transcript_96741/m.144858 type:complete len:138 (-) Transcript_96741:98-511(-)
MEIDRRNHLNIYIDFFHAELPDRTALLAKIKQFKREKNITPMDVIPYQNSWDQNSVIYNVIGDGNCLFRCVSLILWGTENHHQELRLLMFVELREHFVYYLECGGFEMASWLHETVQSVWKPMFMLGKIFSLYCAMH